jgi:hypothetical protein
MDRLEIKKRVASYCELGNGKPEYFCGPCGGKLCDSFNFLYLFVERRKVLDIRCLNEL